MDSPTFPNIPPIEQSFSKESSAMSDDTSHPIATARAWLEESAALMITVGAGMGVDAGLPDFRGPEGLWRVFPGLKKRGMQLMDIATPHWFDEDPALAWGFYGQRLLSYCSAQPHRGHAVLRAWSNRKPSWLVTSNVDGLLQKAGWPDACVWEMHGSIHRWQCSELCCEDRWPARMEELTFDRASGLASRWPHCPHCGAVARPNIMMFGDGFWVANGMAAAERAFRDFVATHSDGILVVELGAGQDISTIRDLSEWLNLCHGARLLRINPQQEEDDGSLSRFCHLPLGAAAALEAIGMP
ncbi:MAG: NAD-dependent deacetylase [Planctomycetota bacterium]|nr:MAG: NAD-dependent deacetylase [Planctomycetota bacterium]